MNKVYVLAAAVLVAAASPASAGASRSCSGTIGSHDGGGLVAFIINTAGVRWWVEMFAHARPCG